MKKILADYQEHREAFRAFVAPGGNSGNSRILLFSGKSGSGKTTLLGACLQEIPKRVTTVPIQMRGSATTVSEILRRVGDRRGWPAMPNFIAALQALPQVQVDANKLVGIGNQINVPAADRAQRRAALTEAWFADLRALDRTYLLAIDTYEDAIPDVQEWLAGPFLARAVTTPRSASSLLARPCPTPTTSSGATAAPITSFSACAKPNTGSPWSRLWGATSPSMTP
ncbi:MAG: hypothetical protein ACLFTI_08745 [Anaerolineales bacterium]